MLNRLLNLRVMSSCGFRASNREKRFYAVRGHSIGHSRTIRGSADLHLSVQGRNSAGSKMLGGLWESVTAAAGLEEAGLIRRCRGRIIILDRKGLEPAAREYYRIGEDEFDHLFNRQKPQSGKPAATSEQAS